MGCHGASLLFVPLVLAASVWVAQPTGAAGIAWAAMLDQPVAWYGSPEAARVADTVLRLQRTNGGWAKNVDPTVPLAPADLERLDRERGQTDTTIDNGATTTEIRFLARVGRATGQARLQAAVIAGLDFILAAEYPRGGWPQYFPLRTDYSRHLTFNDDAIVRVLALLDEVVTPHEAFAFVDGPRRTRARVAIARAVRLMLATQVRVDGRLTAWCAQHDEATREPRPARTYEPASLSGLESVGIVRYLMRLDRPAPEVGAAIEAAVAWFGRVSIVGMRLERVEAPGMPRGFDRRLVPSPGAARLWARFYEIGTDRPLYLQRSGLVVPHYNDIEYERRTGYSWLGPYAEQLLATEYPAWRARVR